MYGGDRAGWEGVQARGETVGSNHRLHLELYFIGSGEAIGISGVAVKCVDIRRKNSGEGGLLDRK